MTDTRMVPAGGVSDEEIRNWLLYGDDDTRTLLDFDQQKNGVDDGVALVRAALARWGAQTEYDAGKVEALLEWVLNDHARTRSHYVYVATATEKAAAVRSSRRPKGRVVEERMKEKVCSDCGSTDPNHPLDKNCPLWDRGWLTRAQFEAEREGR